jgi:hypothetical protein
LSKTHLCTKCKITPSKRSQNKGTSPWCPNCAQEYEKQRWNNLPEWKRRAKWLKTKYGITYEKYENLYNQQEGKCKVCQIEISIQAKQNGHDTACVDHCHTTNKIRGLLCNHCNRALGLLKENLENIESLANYLRSYK